MLLSGYDATCDFEVSDERLARALAQASPDADATPERRFLPEIARESFERLAGRLAGDDRFRIAYSVKTNPRDEILDLAQGLGLYAEVISPQEVMHARRRGYDAGSILYNGPWPAGDIDVAVAFADSLEAFERNTRRSFRTAHGVRLRPNGSSSRFGVGSDELERLTDLARNASQADALAVSLFVRSQDLAGRTWRDVAEEIIVRAADLQTRSGKPVVALDLGGGCSPAEFDERLCNDYPHIAERAGGALADLRYIFAEPGQELATPFEVVIVRVLEVRKRPQRTDVVINSGLPAMPRIVEESHRIFAERDDGWQKLRPGKDRILGCICMEEDVVRSDVALPRDIAEGDVLVIADAGAYDSSMSFDFANGRQPRHFP